MSNLENIKYELARYLKRKGLDINEDEEQSSSILEINYNKYYNNYRIILHIYWEDIQYNTNAYLWSVYQSRMNNKRRSRESIEKLRTKHDRKDYKNAVYKNILRIQGWLDKIAEKEKKVKDDINDYASEIEFYFKEKYGNVELDINDLDGDAKRINATVRYGKDKYIYETHNIIYRNGNYFLDNINRNYNNSYKKKKKIYQQREKKEKNS